MSYGIADALGEFFMIAVVCLIIGGPPILFTVMNTLNLLRKKKIWQTGFEMFTLMVGFFEYIILMGLEVAPRGDYFIAVYSDETHDLIYSENVLSFALPCIVGVISFFVLCLGNPRKLPPLVTAVSVAGVLMGNIMQILYGVQVLPSGKEDVLIPVCFWVYHVNLLLISAAEIKRYITEQSALIKERDTQPRSRFAAQLYRLMSSVSGMSGVCFLLVFPLAAVLEIILVLCGQGPDGVIKAFTMTADWTFSTQIPPPPMEYQGHYLCTVAAGGHRKLVKPLRPGTRQSHTIIVNRQLAVANAFEQLLEERMPRIQRRVRRFYDSHGYPLSRLITTPLRADIVYILMKPLEWLFLLVLYTFDSHPENRIAKQYEYKNEN